MNSTARRSALSLSIAIAAVMLPAAAPAQTPAQTPAQNAPAAAIKNIVLVHGAWADGSSWSGIVPLLQARGFHVVCVQNPLTSLADDVAATRRIVDAQDGPVLLVGHSYGGMVITEAGANPKVAGLVYVAAYAPEKGESLLSLAKPYGPQPLLSEVQPIADGFVLISPKGIAEDFAQDLPTAQKDLAFATQGATQSAAFATPVSTAAWHGKPSWFVVAANDRAISPEQERFTAKRMNAKTLILASSHVAMLAKPKEVADFIAEAASTPTQPAATQ